jgi:diaminohydroxyphosphoribosylaminopyrimidine deaminase / 5-amino-6-(5-phosphoribosylamino)uracil reductase
MLRRALALARTHRGFCAPNPCVGAVLIQNGQIIAEGAHQGSGSPHAEAVVLTPLTLEQTQGATLYVTLQPCCHTNKKTPPCTQLIIDKKLAQVVYAFQDPNPAVGTTSDTLLQQAGIPCIYHPLPEIDEFYASYAFWWKTERPWVTAKIALSLDGKITRRPGERTHLTGPEAGQFTHQQRQQADALLTTAHTILADDPKLNIRLNTQAQSQPLYVLDRLLKVPLSAQIFSTAKQVTLFHQSDLPSVRKTTYLQKGVRLIPILSDDKGLKLLSVLQQIGHDGHHDLWVESGARCFTQLAQTNLLQRALVYVAPICLGSSAQTAFESPPFDQAKLSQPPRVFGRDVCFTFDWPTPYK